MPFGQVLEWWALIVVLCAGFAVWLTRRGL